MCARRARRDHLWVWALKSSERANSRLPRATQRTIKTEVALTASASDRMLARCPAVSGSPWIERVDVYTPGRLLPCIAGLSVRQETPPRHRSPTSSASHDGSAVTWVSTTPCKLGSPDGGHHRGVGGAVDLIAVESIAHADAENTGHNRIASVFGVPVRLGRACWRALKRNVN